MTINRVEPVSIARIAGVVYACIGLLIGALFSIIAMLGMAFSGSQRGLSQNAVSPMVGAVIGLGAIVVSPILYGLLGFVFALIAAWLYNLVASKVGGIKVDIS